MTVVFTGLGGAEFGAAQTNPWSGPPKLESLMEQGGVQWRAGPAVRSRSRIPAPGISGSPAEEATQ